MAVDALDNMPSRFQLEKACRDSRIPLVHGAVAGFTGQVTTIYPKTSVSAPFTEIPKRAGKGDRSGAGESGRNCFRYRFLQVQEVIKVLTGLGRPLRNGLLFIDSLNGAAETISLK